MRWFVEQSALIQGFIATLFTYGVTAAGAAVVLAIRCVNKKVLDVMMSFSAGVMIAASYWSLLEPAFALAKELDKNAAVTVTLGFFMGGLFIVASDILLEKRMVTDYKEEGFKRCILLITAVTMHNVPEGLAIGVAFGCAGICGGREAVTVAIMLAVGIEFSGRDLCGNATQTGRDKQGEKLSGWTIFWNGRADSRCIGGIIRAYRAKRASDGAVLFCRSNDRCCVFGTDTGIF